jgi:ATP-dependent Clp protease ATP-binding subunit ClpC
MSQQSDAPLPHRFTDRARLVVDLAQEEARMLNHDHVGPEHILLGLVHEGEGVAGKALESLGISLEAVRHQVEEILGPGRQAPSGRIPLTPAAKNLLVDLSLRQALQLGHNYIGTEHILLGLVRDRDRDKTAAQILVKLGADPDRVRQRVIQLVHGYQGRKPEPTAADSAGSVPPTSAVLDRLGRNLSQSAREGRLDPVIGREKEIERVIQVLSRRTKNNPVLVGAHGVGKTVVVEGLAQKIVRGQALPSMRDKLVYRIDAETLSESSASQDEAKAHLQAAVKEARTRGDVILFLDGLRALSADLWAILNPMLSRGEVQIIGATTPDEYRDLLEENTAFERTFVAVPMAEPTVGQTIEILKGLRDRYEAHHRVSITNGALVAVAEAACQRLPGERLPGNAVDLMDEAAALCRMRNHAPPPELRDYDEQIAGVRKAKEAEIDAQDFEKAAALRDSEKQLLAKRAAVEREWQAGTLDGAAAVDEELVAETLSIMLGLSSDGAGDVGQVPAAQRPRFAPAAMTDDDREIWGMS